MERGHAGNGETPVELWTLVKRQMIYPMFSECHALRLLIRRAILEQRQILCF
jgi:hypothetical protein